MGIHFHNLIQDVYFCVILSLLHIPLVIILQLEDSTSKKAIYMHMYIYCHYLLLPYIAEGTFHLQIWLCLNSHFWVIYSLLE